MENGQNLIFNKDKKESTFSSSMQVVLVVTLIVVLISFATIYFLTMSNKGKIQSVTKKVTFDQYQSFSMRENEYPRGFPMDIVIKTGATWQRAEDTTIAETKERQLIVDLKYSFSESEMLGVYNTLLVSKGWTMNYKKTPFYIYGKDGATLTLTIVSVDNGTLVDLKFVDKK